MSTNGVTPVISGNKPDEGELSRFIQLKEHAKKMFINNNFKEAEVFYSKAAKELLSYIETDTQSRQNCIDCLNNIAQCDINLNEYSKALVYVNRVLEYDDNNFKALYRKGISL